MNKKIELFRNIPWTWKEFISMLVLVLILVPFFIEFLLQNALTNFFQNDLYAGTLTGFIMSIIFIGGLYFIAIRPKKLGWKEVGLQPFPIRYLGNIIGWTVFLIIISIMLSYILEFLFNIGTDNNKTESVQSRLSTINILIAFVSAAIISPIYEEIFYRGFLYRWLRTKYGVLNGILVSSFIFMLVHIPTYNSLPYTFVSGVVFAWTYEKTKSVYPAMIIHGLFNGVSVVLMVVLA
ncbi:CPBP family intramembrane glutamic endopeptidase [Ornithinibacillus halotolerans]|uniref:CAAX amino protease n=1 Tax=Ornithinibacillus halotolerans TaxID=1274357 RepID=A0A916W6Q3_9BACI|nr:type II CAAX endopeptidase family protein [Ornithinibacillus halotolerans]GGA72709.1 CAAX amino protease [Ornithinibacillus halotolerans]